jgi:AcrR family transcriptional regulator
MSSGVDMPGRWRIYAVGMATEPRAEASAPRPRDSAATRLAILAAATGAFARLGYDGAGLREIAGEAGVDPRLIGRYFGSKEKLFAAVFYESSKKPLLIVPGTTREVAQALLGEAVPAQLEGMLLTLRSSSSERAVEIMRANVERNYQGTLAALLPGPDADGRAALLVSICAGVQLMRNVLGSTALNGEAVDRLVPYLQAAFDAIADPPTA